MVTDMCMGLICSYTLVYTFVLKQYPYTGFTDTGLYAAMISNKYHVNWFAFPVRVNSLSHRTSFLFSLLQYRSVTLNKSRTKS